MATIHICDKCGVRPPSSWYGLEVFEYDSGGQWRNKSTRLDLCEECYRELVADFDFTKRNTPDVEVVVM